MGWPGLAVVALVALGGLGPAAEELVVPAVDEMVGCTGSAAQLGSPEDTVGPELEDPGDPDNPVKVGTSAAAQAAARAFSAWDGC